MRRIRVGVKFCGHCNPLLDGGEMVTAAALLDDRIDFVSWLDPELQQLLIVSGCPIDCVERPPFTGEVVHVAGQRVDGKMTPLPEVPDAIVRSILRRAGIQG
ncbi:MAG: hypothetical protein IH614_04415 [Desulfuromonadales bacterium]|nr:hypothetical protein [Desulfuromonadales bacterium]